MGLAGSIPRSAEPLHVLDGPFPCRPRHRRYHHRRARHRIERPSGFPQRPPAHDPCLRLHDAPDRSISARPLPEGRARRRLLWRRDRQRRGWPVPGCRWACQRRILRSPPLQRRPPREEPGPVDLRPVQPYVYFGGTIEGGDRLNFSPEADPAVVAMDDRFVEQVPSAYAHTLTLQLGKAFVPLVNVPVLVA